MPPPRCAASWSTTPASASHTSAAATWQRVTDFDHVPAELRLDADLLDLDEALRKLEAAEPRLAQLVELRYFAGLGEIEIASLQERSERSVRRDWHKARLFLLGALAADG
ncbi:MAG: ECF-type sigma factor [Chiayiivirga sp.]|jgi:DNA-directed RNA polymerase specialized sigma24 family protein|nr:ECF-type sigma factor [Chiayiivirga sp.]